MCSVSLLRAGWCVPSPTVCPLTRQEPRLSWQGPLCPRPTQVFRCILLSVQFKGSHQL